MKKILSLLLLVVFALSGPNALAAGSSATVTGPSGQKLWASKTKAVSDGTKVSVRGRGYNTKHGIYVTYCVVPAKGKKPTECGPFDITGQNNSAVWLSSNPPLYAALIVSPFSSEGSFKVSINVTRKIGDFDCKKVRCAITTRADHTNASYRKADVFIPITIK
jgi:hypothetical protein